MNSRTLHFTAAFFLFSLISVTTSFAQGSGGETGEERTLFTRLSQEISGIDFTNMVIEDEEYNINLFIYAYNGGGIGVGDVDNDGLLDLYFTGTQSHTPNRLYRNLGGMKFEDISAKAGVDDSIGVRYGVTMVDINNDGAIDIYVNKQEDPNTLFVNNGKGKFTEQAKKYGLDFCCASTHTAFFDYDLDGDLDAYIGTNGDAKGDDYQNKGKTDRLFRNDGGTFVDVTKESGIHDEGYALSVSIGDVNNDGWPDIHITNDFIWPDMLYINNRDGTFTETAGTHMSHTTEFGMGADIADFNKDGLLDIVSVDMLPEDHWRKMSHMGSQNGFSPLFDSIQFLRNNLHLNRGDGYFSEVAQLSGVDETDWSWSPLFADFDHDGETDLFITNGYKRDVANKDVIEYFTRSATMEMLLRVPSIKLKNYAYRNRGDLTFEKVSDEWGVGDYVNSNGGIYADLDNDGDLDLIINNIDTVSAIYRNNAESMTDGHWLKVNLEGSKENPFGVGARVQVDLADGTSQIREFTPVRGYLSSSYSPIHFGLGKESRVSKLTVTWPDGAAETMENIRVDRTITLKRSDASDGVDIAQLRRPRSAERFPQLLRELDSAATGFSFFHHESQFDDFNRERLMPHMLSKNGPGIAVGDINGDGLDDVWIGGSLTRSATIFEQSSPGMFTRRSLDGEDLAAIGNEDMGAVFLDADGDGDRDLYVASGSNETDGPQPSHQDRLYINDGSGNFTHDTTALPQMHSSTASVSAADFDGDGDLDIFVGGRCVPGRYPDIPTSFLLRNDGGRFTDVTDELAPDTRRIGMLTSVLWSDYDGDGRVDLLVGGEWMGIRFLRNDGEKFVDMSEETGIGDITGWWHSISPGDIDNDGDIDYLLGNMGRNTRQTHQPTQEYPIRLYANDFDRNTSRDLVMSYFFRGYEFPARNRQAMISQMGTYTKRRFPTYTSYSTSIITQVIDSTLIADGTILEANTFQNVWIENLGDGKFAMHELPVLAQSSPVFGSLLFDINGDGNLDVLALENFFGADPEVMRYDAGLGLVMLGDGAGSFEVQPSPAAGFVARHDGRGLAAVHTGNDTRAYFIAINNSGWAQLFSKEYRSDEARLFRLDDNEALTHGMIHFADGRKQRVEFPIGSGYLTQSSRMVAIAPSMEKIDLYNGEDRVRQVLFIEE